MNYKKFLEYLIDEYKGYYFDVIINKQVVGNGIRLSDMYIDIKDRKLNTCTCIEMYKHKDGLRHLTFIFDKITDIRLHKTEKQQVDEIYFEGEYKEHNKTKRYIFKLIKKGYM